MPIPKSLLRKKKKKAWKPRYGGTYIPPEFAQGLAMQAGAAAAIGAANQQIAQETVTSFVVIDRRRGSGLARPMSAKLAIQEYGPEIRVAIGDMDAGTLGRLHSFRAAPAYNPATASVALSPDVTLLHLKSWRQLHPPLPGGRLRLL